MNILSKFQLPISYCLLFMIYEDLEEKADSLTDLMNYLAVYRTAPATPNLLINTKMNNAYRKQ